MKYRYFKYIGPMQRGVFRFEVNAQKEHFAEFFLTDTDGEMVYDNTRKWKKSWRVFELKRYLYKEYKSDPIGIEITEISKKDAFIEIL